VTPPMPQETSRSNQHCINSLGAKPGPRTERSKCFIIMDIVTRCGAKAESSKGNFGRNRYKNCVPLSLYIECRVNTDIE
jgi:hypothetical protein